MLQPRGCPSVSLVDQQNEQTGSESRPRRSQRVLLSLPVLVQAEEGNHSVLEETQTLVVNAHGALIALSMQVHVGQRLVLKNQKSQEEQPCKVVYLGTAPDRKTHVGVEFEQPAPRFWRIAFPPEDWEPRSSASGVRSPE